MENVLDTILRRKREEVAARRAQVSVQEMRARAADAPPARGFAAAIEARIASGHAAVIAEIKQASPSRGIIRTGFDPPAIACSYAANDATCLSVLTDADFFKGSDADLQRARAACTLPVLRKDFTIDPYQIFEARALGADCILLIVAALNDVELADLAGLAADIGLDALVEIHDGEELERALRVPAPLLGINNRDLRTFNVSLDTSAALCQRVPAGRRPVSESGIHTPTDVARLRTAGINAFLVGEALLRETDPGQALRQLFAP